jgi:hypothetical protein
MSHRAVEIVLGRLATDEALRRRFEQGAAHALEDLQAQGLELSAVERSALESLDPSALAQFARSLDTRLQKAALLPEAGR